MKFFRDEFNFFDLPTTDRRDGRVGARVMKKNSLSYLFASCLVALSCGCSTTPGRITGIGSATGGLLGAGLGAIIGSQTGDPATGVVIGGAAGTVAGAVIANKFEAEEEIVSKNRELSRDNDLEIARRREEISSLRTQTAMIDRDYLDSYGSNNLSGRNVRIDVYAEGGDLVTSDSTDVQSVKKEENRFDTKSQSILPIDVDDVRPIYVERKGMRGYDSELDSSLGNSVGDTELASVDEAVTKTLTTSPKKEDVSLKKEIEKLHNDKKDNTTKVKKISPPVSGSGVNSIKTTLNSSPKKIDGGVSSKVVVREVQSQRSKSQVRQVRGLEGQAKVERTIGNLERSKKILDKTSGGLATDLERKREQGRDTARSIKAPTTLTKADASRASVKVPTEKLASSEKSKTKTIKDQPQSSAKISEGAKKGNLKTNNEEKISKEISGECQEAAEEISKSKGVSESAEKLFHYRRALRLCPSNPRYHVQLGDHYKALKRFADASFEYKEALALDPSNGDLKRKIEELKNG